MSGQGDHLGDGADACDQLLVVLRVAASTSCMANTSVMP
jgi:hypothetical protein